MSQMWVYFPLAPSSGRIHVPVSVACRGLDEVWGKLLAKAPARTAGWTWRTTQGHSSPRGWAGVDRFDIDVQSSGAPAISHVLRSRISLLGPLRPDSPDVGTLQTPQRPYCTR